VRRWSQVVAVVAVLATLATSASAQTPSLEQQLDERAAERSRTEQRLAETKDAEADARERLAEADRQLARVTAELAAVEEALAAATAARDRARAEVGRLRAELAGVEVELAEAEADLDVAKARLGARAAGAYKRGGTATETVIVGQFLAAEDIGAALATTPFLTAVLDADRRIVDDVQELLGTVQRQRGAVAALRVAAERETRTAEAQADEVARRVREQRDLTAEVATRRAEQNAALEALEGDRRAMEDHLSGIEQEAAQIQDQIAALAEQRAAEARQREQEAARQREQEAARQREEEAARQREEEAARQRDQEDRESRDDASDDAGSGGDEGGSKAPPEATPAPPPPSDGWAWPNSCRRVTSRYGPRNVTGGSGYHMGVDIACTRMLGPNPPIMASRAGVVSTISCGGGYGVCLIVDHLDGDFTLYAHMSSTAVARGASVGHGQVIGYEGSTGNSSGPHLHFELWKAGVKTDPCPYIGC
jgi:murein DD-endopeptidase MepM/ murein hydrolase activator NlpD